MKNRRLPLLVSAAFLSALSFGVTAPVHAADKPDRPKRAMGVNKRLIKAIEDKTGKPLTDDQKSKIADATKIRQDAMQAAIEKYQSDVAAAVGLTADEVRELEKPVKKPDAAAPAPATAPAAAPAP